MKVTGYNGFVFADLGVTASSGDIAAVGPSRMHTEQPRLDRDPLVPQVTTGAEIRTVTFTVIGGAGAPDNETTLQMVLARLGIDDPGPARRMTGETNLGVPVESYGLPTTWRPGNANQLVVDFAMETIGWQAIATSEILAVQNLNNNATIINNNDGRRDLNPEIEIGFQGTQRATTTADIGWKHRLGDGLELTNVGTEPLRNQPYQIGPIDTRSLVTAGQMLTSGNDFRVFAEGCELRRNMIAPNTRYTFIWIVLPDLDPGESITIEFLTNNPNAGSPPTLTTSSDPMLPAMDINGLVFNPTSATTTSVGTSGLEVDMWPSATIYVDNAANTGAAGNVRRVSGNSTTALNVDRAFSSAPLTTDTIIVVRSGALATGGLVTAATASTLRDNQIPFYWDNAYIGATVELQTGAGAGQTRTITAFDSGLQQITVSPNWTTTPAVGDRFRVYKNNGLRIWDVRNGDPTHKDQSNHKGLWFANKHQAPPTSVHWDAPASWYRFTYLRNEDEYSQPRYVSKLVGAGDFDHYPILQIQRARQGKRGTMREAGVADAIGTYSPFPMNRYMATFNFRNAKKAGTGSPGEGMCEALVLVQEDGGELWSTAFSDKSVYNSSTYVVPTNYQLDGYGSPNRLAIALIPNGGDEIPENDNNTALLEQPNIDQIWAILVDPQLVLTESFSFWTAPPAAVAVLDVHLRIKNHGAGTDRPYNQLEIGGEDRRLFLAATEQIRIDCERKRVTLETTSDVVIRPIPYAVQAQEVVDDADGNSYTRVDGRWLPVPVDPGDGSEDLRITDPSGAGWGTITIGIDGRFGYLA